MLINKSFMLHCLSISLLVSGGLFISTTWADLGKKNLPTTTIVPIQSDSNWREWLTTLPTGITLRNSVTLNQLYTSNHMQPFWQDRQARYQFQQQLAEIALAGVQPQFAEWVKWLADPALNDHARDLLLSDALLGYISFVTEVAANGRRWLYGLGSVKLQVPSDIEINRWQKAFSQGFFEEYLLSLAPQHPQYAKMHAALKHIMADRDPRLWPQVSDGPSLKVGGSSNDIPALREILSRTGVLYSAKRRAEKVTPVVTALRRDGITDDSSDSRSINELNDHIVGSAGPEDVSKEYIYSQDLVAAIERFQEWHGLQPDGVIGKRTREWLNVTPQTRAGLLALNIQRLRILPVQVENAIMVNIPDYSLVFYRNGAEVLASRVIVGSPRRKTPLMNSTLFNVVVNPPWNVPTKLVREDIVPKVKHDPDYLQRLNYTLFSGWDNDSRVIDPSMIDWHSVSASSFPYRVRQAPGSNNALGRYKFNMPNSEAIYLHDTPNHGLFNKDIRALSSGCVRVNKASELASMLLQEVGWNSSRVSSTLQTGDTTYVNIRQQIPVELYYLSAWVGDNGLPQYRTDIYNYDDIARLGANILPQAKILLK